MSDHAPVPSELNGFFGRRWRRFLKESALLRQYIWKYRNLVGIGLLALISVDALEILPPLYLKDAVDVIVDHGAGGALRKLYVVAAAYLFTAILQGFGRYGWRMYLIRASL